jgi:hypothetical protein
MARLDRLGPAREVAQVGSVIGRGFSYALLCTLTGMGDAALQAALEQLAEADILLVQGFPPDSDYRFKHALIQDAAYENLLKSRRQVLHRRVAEILRDRFPDTAAAEPEVLAHHFTQAGLTEAAIEWWGNAGEQALRRSAFQEAVSHLGKAIEMAEKTGEGTSATATVSATANQRLKLQTNLGKALMYSRGFGAEESKAAFIRARELAAAIDNATERFTIYYGLWIGNLLRGELGFAREIAETFLHEAERGARMTECGYGRGLLGQTCLFQGDFIEARANLVEALSIYDPERDRDARLRFGRDTGVTARAYLAITKWQLGEVGPARALIEEAGKHALETGHVPTLVNVYVFKAHFEMVRGDAGAARRDAEIVVELGQANALTLFTATGALQSAWASARLDGGEAHATELRRALAAYTNQGNKQFVPFSQGLLAEIEARDDAGGALTRIEEALDRRTLERCFPASLARRDSAQARSGEHGAGRGCIPHRSRHRTAAEGAQFRAARGALAGEALSINGPIRRRPRLARTRARGLFADPGISRDRGSANASCRAGAMSQSKEAKVFFWHIPAIAAGSCGRSGDVPRRRKKARRFAGPSHFTTGSHQWFVIMLRPREQQRP